VPLSVVILAAGESRRLGTCKALVRLREREPATPLAMLCAAARTLDATPLVVTGAQHVEIARELPPGAIALENRAWRAGRTLGIALAARARSRHDLCLAPVDVPLVEPHVFEALAAAWRAAGEPARGWLAPFVMAHGARHFGHPVVVGRALAAELDALAPDEPLRHLRRGAVPCLALEVETPSVLEDLDEPADLERLRAILAARGAQ
jgi:CTP:molybdopterin cytidylyltransferase MocA